MAYKCLSTHQLHPGTHCFKTTPSNLPVESRVTLLYDSSNNHDYGRASDLFLDTTTYGDASQKQIARRPDHAIEHPLDTVAIESGSEDQSALCSRQLPSYPHNSQEVMATISENPLPSLDGNLQHHAGWGVVPPPITRSYSPPGCIDQEDQGFVASPTIVNDLPQTPINQKASNVANSPTSGQQNISSPPNSVKHLTCWYWAQNGCRLPDHVCLYSHSDTGRLAGPPVQIQPGRAFPSQILYLRPSLLPKSHFEKLKTKLTAD